MPGGSCTFTLRFVAHGFASDTTFKVLSRADASSNPWVLGPNPVLVSGGEASTYDATLVLASVQGGSPNQVQLAVLAFAGASASSATEVQELNQTAATFAFVTQVLTVNVVTPTMTPTPTARPTNTPTPTRTPTATSTPGANDCCQCASSCAVPVGGMCDSSCTVIFGATCYGELLCTARTPTPTLTPSPTATPCLKDNGDGTISDGCTGLMWEKKDQAGGLHDYSASYPWALQCGDLTPCQPDAASAAACYEATNGAVGCSQCSGGSCEFRFPVPEGAPTPTTTIWGWLVQLNQGEGFAGYTDWRIPTVDKEGNAGELETILLSTCTVSGPCVRLAFDTDCPQPSLCDASHPCSAGRSCVIPTPMPGAEGTCSESGCTVTSCSCTWSGYYWSATSDVPTPTPVSTLVPTSVIPTPEPLALAYFVDFSSASVFSDLKMLPGYVRAVRGTKTPPPTVAPGAGDCCQCASSCAAPVDGTCGSCAVVFDAACDGEQLCALDTPTPTPTPCLQDNGDGTITDGCTGLMWEKKDQAGGLHDYSTLYTWAGVCTGDTSLCQPNAGAAAACAGQTGGAVGCAECGSGTCIVDPNQWGAPTTIWDWLNQLNSSVFGGYNDWRIPSVGQDGGRPELETILAAPYPCTGMSFPCVSAVFDTDCAPGCTVTNCSCTVSDYYWSATTDVPYSGDAWTGNFRYGGFGDNTPKAEGFAVRAVRGGP
ncbi:MAG: DUF1566 domain-containing protein [Candidatus Binatia bacterium]